VWLCHFWVHILDFATVAGYIPDMGAVFSCCWERMLELVVCSFDVAGHGDVNVVLFIVPFDGEATVECGGPDGRDGVQAVNCLDEVVGIRFVLVFDEEVQLSTTREKAIFRV
jgi:hypothetical protein